MSGSKKAILSAVSFIGVIALVSFILAFFVPHQDAVERKKLAGSLDLIFVGASHTQNSIIPQIIDEGLGTNSYNLAIGSMTTADRKIMIQKETGRNPIKTVVLELSLGALLRSVKNDAADGNFHMFNRMDTFSEKVSYLFKRTPVDNWAYIYARSMVTSIYSIMSGNFGKEPSDRQRGYLPVAARDYTLGKKQIVEEYQQNVFSIDEYNKDSVKEFENTIDFCNEKGVRLIVIVAPVSDGFLWKYKNVDEFQDWLSGLCKEKGVEFYNFHLLKNKYKLLSDSKSYGASQDHMSDDGAKVFSKFFVDFIKKTDSGEDVSDLFYDSYVDMIKDSPYMEYYKSVKSDVK